MCLQNLSELKHALVRIHGACSSSGERRCLFRSAHNKQFPDAAARSEHQNDVIIYRFC